MTMASNLRVWRLTPLLLIVVILCPFAHSKSIYVDDDAVGNNDGTSWENAYIYLQDALADAKVAEKPVEVRIAQGIYKPDQGTGLTPGDRGATFKLLNDVKLVGGYAGFEQYDPNARDIELYRTILSGDLDSNDVDVNAPRDLLNEPTRAENSYHVVSGNGADKTAVLNGLTITAGNTKGSNQYSYGVGGGMYNHRGEPNLINCTFSGNVAGHGGGMFNRYNKPILTNCIFKDNSAESYGGGMYNYQSIITSVINCIFSGNSAGHGGGIYIQSSSTPQNCQIILTSCTFSENLAEYDGGGLLLDSKNYSYNYSSNFSLTNCTFKANGAGDTGGGIYVCGGESILRNCLFHCNSGENGNALACYSYLYGDPSVVELTNCILWDDDNQIWNADDSIITITYSDIKDGQASVHDPYEKITWGVGNIDSDPCFADPANHDYHLKSQAGRWDPNNQIWIEDGVTSACIDAGDPLTAIGYEPYPNGHRINIGVLGGTQQASMSVYDVNSFKAACVPNPYDGGVDVVLDIMPGWISEPNVVMHDIYFGTSELPPFFRQQYQSEFYPGALKPDTRYYWRIDDIDNLLNRAIGNVWTFLTGPQPAHAYGPNPVNETYDVVAFRIILTWYPGLKAVEHNVYLGTDFEDVYQATIENPSGVLLSVAQEPNYFNPDGLEFEQTYYWRVDEIDDQGIITTGNIWMFTTGSQPVNAYNPNPPDGAMGVSPNITLSWSPGKNVVAHDVYFGSTYPPHFVRNQTETDFNPGRLGSQARCYWRIDEIDNQGNIITGDAWKFTVTEYKGRLCFTGQTLVWINDSFIPISKVNIGQSINGINRIEEVQEHEGTYTLYDILLESGNCITVAENHIFMTESGNWFSLHKLKAGMRLKTFNGSIGIQSVTKQPIPYTVKVYNLKIADSDRYTVGKDMVIVRDY